MVVRKVHQREIVEVNFYFPGEGYKPHPALVVSSDDLHDAEEGMFYALLISSKNIHPDYTIEIKKEDLIGKELDKQSYFVTHFLSYFTLNDVSASRNTMVKVNKFDEVVQKCIDSIFGPPLSSY